MPRNPEFSLPEDYIDNFSTPFALTPEPFPPQDIKERNKSNKNAKKNRSSLRVSIRYEDCEYVEDDVDDLSETEQVLEQPRGYVVSYATIGEGFDPTQWMRRNAEYTVAQKQQINWPNPPGTRGVLNFREQINGRINGPLMGAEFNLSQLPREDD